ncbi:hypothetical protein OF83DRAFT_642797 [Amylostereum chailletii]|nr:hypothetical protein OF83DRAFT_642797 [Amylostereum chailletii]
MFHPLSFSASISPRAVATDEVPYQGATAASGSWAPDGRASSQMQSAFGAVANSIIDAESLISSTKTKLYIATVRGSDRTMTAPKKRPLSSARYLNRQFAS